MHTNTNSHWSNGQYVWQELRRLENRHADWFIGITVVMMVVGSSPDDVPARWQSAADGYIWHQHALRSAVFSFAYVMPRNAAILDSALERQGQALGGFTGATTA